MAATKLFREKAIKAYVDPTVKGGVLRIVSPSVTVVVLALASLLLVGAGIVLFGQARVSVSARGIVRPRGGLLEIRAPASGFITALPKSEGTPVVADQLLVSLSDPVLTASLLSLQTSIDSRRQLLAQAESRSGPVPMTREEAAELDALRQAVQAGEAELAPLQARANLLKVVAPLNATIAQLHVHTGEYVREGDNLAALIPADAPLVGYVAVPEKERPSLRVGGQVRLKLDAYPFQESGFAEGTVLRIGNDILSERWEKQLDSTSSPGQLRLVLVEVSLDSLPSRAKGTFENGMVFTAELLIGKQRIVSLLF